jgi:MFS transporter, LPLT family, lysophospholipid transporter
VLGLGLAKDVPATALRPTGLTLPIDTFVVGSRLLFRDALSAACLSLTALFWASGSALQLMVLAWGVQSFQLSTEHAVYLQAVVALGVALGAGVAGLWVSLASAPKLIPLGVAIGGLVGLCAGVDQLAVAVALLAAIGILAGLLIVPVNALLLHRGSEILGAGRCVAHQGFNENLSALLILGLYAQALSTGLSLAHIMIALGALLALGSAVIWRRCWAASAGAHQALDEEASMSKRSN